jgi:hypothetical protein
MGTVNGVGAVTSLKTGTRAGDDSAQSVVAARRFATETAAPAAPVEIDEVTQQPLPPRFPWLSRLALQLEAAAKQRSTFPPAPVLGDNLDKTA